MIDPTASLTFPLYDGTNDLVFSGADDGSQLGLSAMNEPGRQPRITYADDSPDVAGSLAIQFTWQQAMLNASVILDADTQADLEALKAKVWAALGRLKYSAVTEVNGTRYTWTCDAGTVTPANDTIDFTDVRDVVAVYNLSIPVQPIPGA